MYINTPQTPKWSLRQVRQLCRRKNASPPGDVPALAGVRIPYPFGLVGATIHLAPCADEARSLTVLHAHDPDLSRLEVLGDDDAESLAVDLLVRDAHGAVIRRFPLEERIEIACILPVLRERLFFPIGNGAFQVSVQEGEKLLTALARIEFVMEDSSSRIMKVVTRNLAPKVFQYPLAPHEQLLEVVLEGIRVTFGLPTGLDSSTYDYLGWLNFDTELEGLRDFIQLAPLG